MRSINSAKAEINVSNLMTYIHPSTIINDEFEMGENCFIFENNVIQPLVKLEDDVIIWTGNVISHHTTISCEIYDGEIY